MASRRTFRSGCSTGAFATRLQEELDRAQSELEQSESRATEMTSELEALRERVRELEAQAELADSAERQAARTLRERDEQLVHLQLRYLEELLYLYLEELVVL